MAIPEEASNVIAWSSLDQLYKSLLCRIWLLDFFKFQGMPFPNRSITITIVQWLKHAKYSYKEGKGSIKKMGRVQKLYFLVEFSVEDLTHTPHPPWCFLNGQNNPPSSSSVDLDIQNHAYFVRKLPLLWGRFGFAVNGSEEGSTIFRTLTQDRLI